MIIYYARIVWCMEGKTLAPMGATLVGARRPARRAEIAAQRAATRAAPTQNPFPSILKKHTTRR